MTTTMTTCDILRPAFEAFDSFLFQQDILSKPFLVEFLTQEIALRYARFSLDRLSETFQDPRALTSLFKKTLETYHAYINFPRILTESAGQGVYIVINHTKSVGQGVYIVTNHNLPKVQETQEAITEQALLGNDSQEQLFNISLRIEDATESAFESLRSIPSVFRRAMNENIIRSGRSRLFRGLLDARIKNQALEQKQRDFKESFEDRLFSLQAQINHTDSMRSRSDQSPKVQKKYVQKLQDLKFKEIQLCNERLFLQREHINSLRIIKCYEERLAELKNVKRS